MNEEVLAKRRSPANKPLLATAYSRARTATFDEKMKVLTIVACLAVLGCATHRVAVSAREALSRVHTGMRIDLVEMELGDPDEREICVLVTPHDQWLTYAYPDGTVLVTVKQNEVTSIERKKGTSNQQVHGTQ